MKQINLIAVLFLATGIVKPSFAQLPANQMKNPEGFKAALSKLSDEINTIESSFTQVKVLSLFEEKIISKGSFIYKKENQVRWEYVTPYPYLIIISNNQLFVREETAEKKYDLADNAMFREMNRFISGCIRGDILKNEKDYRVSYFEDKDSYFVRLIPVSEAMRRMLAEVHLYFNKSDLTVWRVKMIEPGDDYTQIDFTNKRLNVPVSAEKFSFK